MFSNYEIRYIDGEEVLYIFIADSYEFARFNKGEKRKNFLKIITEFIKNNHIKFAGSTIALVAGGLVIGNVFLNKDDNFNFKNCIVSLHLNPQVVNAEVISDELLDKTSIDEKIVYENLQENNKVSEEIENTENIKKDNDIVIEIKEEDIVETKEEVNNQSFEEAKETVTVFRTNGEVLTLELEEYLINVVAAEMPASFNIEALKAQSVLARTYARKALRNGKVLTDGVSTQVYKDNLELKSMWKNDYEKYYEKVKKAVIETNGEVLKYHNDYIEAVYHSTSNGYTEDASNVWGNSFPYLKVVASNVDKNVKNYSVTTFFSYLKLSDMLGFYVDNSVDFSILERNESFRVSSVSIGKNTYTGIQLRALLGLRSADFSFEKTSDGVNITTLGYGHGVGMSQYGANEMAKNGYSYKDILSHYYSGTSLVKE